MGNRQPFSVLHSLLNFARSHGFQKLRSQKATPNYETNFGQEIGTEVFSKLFGPGRNKQGRKQARLEPVPPLLFPFNRFTARTDLWTGQ